MKKIVIKFGLIACAITVGVPVIAGLFLGFGLDSFAQGEILGYTSIVVAMCLVYFAMRQVQENVNAGQLSFGEGLKIGVLISAMGGVAFAAYNLIFVTWIMPDFNEQYFSYNTGIEMGTPQFEKEFSVMMEQNGWMFSTWGVTVLMFLTVFLIGFVISVISALLLQQKTPATAQ